MDKGAICLGNVWRGYATFHQRQEGKCETVEIRLENDTFFKRGDSAARISFHHHYHFPFFILDFSMRVLYK